MSDLPVGSECSTPPNDTPFYQRPLERIEEWMEGEVGRWEGEEVRWEKRFYRE